MYPPEALEDVRSGNDIVSVVSLYVPLRQRGGSLLGLCPFHREKTPSFSVRPDRQTFHCFGCGAGGNVFTFVMMIENFDFLDALRFLADRIHYTLPVREAGGDHKKQKQIKDEIFEINKSAAHFFYEQLGAPEGRAAAAYLDARGVSKRMRVKFGLGYCPLRTNALAERLNALTVDPGNVRLSDLTGPRFIGRLIFPIFDASGKITGFGARALNDDNIKYINTSETPVFEKSKNLYAINFARVSKQKTFILVEGYMDVLSLHQAGFNNAVASLGTAVNREHAKLLKKFCETVVVLFDSDPAGVNAALKAIPVLESQGLKVKVLQLSGAKDPDEYINKYGAGSFGGLLEEALSGVAFKINDARQKYDLAKTDGKIAFTTNAAEILAQIENLIERDAYINEISSLTGISASAISKETDRISGRDDARPINADPKLSYAERGRLNERGAEEAAKAVIVLAAASERLCGVINNYLEFDEMPLPVYARCMKIIYDERDNGRPVREADLITRFEDVDDQRAISGVFYEPAVQPEGKDGAAMEKTLTELIRTIKLRYIERKAAEPGQADPKETVKLVEKKRAVANLSVKL